MKTYIAKSSEIERKYYLIDAKNKILGKIATLVADVIRGKNKPFFSPHMDCGDYVIIINADKVNLTGKKMEDKTYYHHTGYPGGVVGETAKHLIERKPEKVLEKAIHGMLPKNKLRKSFMQKVKIYAGESHPHEAQKPEILEV